jgi:hypothetical protein
MAWSKKASGMAQTLIIGEGKKPFKVALEFFPHLSQDVIMYIMVNYRLCSETFGETLEYFMVRIC